ncbi:MAG: hypothetical protein WD009_06610 [Phycisphaeraceae bacterium]
MSIQALRTEMSILNMRTRMPFRYGIATLTSLPHLFVRITFDIDGQRVDGIAAEGLAPKWFTKDPATSVEADVADMLAVIRAGCGFAEQAGSCASVFALWRHVYAAQAEWAQSQPHPPLLWSFGVTLLERAAIDAWCKAKSVTFADAVRSGALGLEPGDVHAELKGASPASLLPAQPSRRIAVRHTVGLGDPLRDEDIPAPERVDDGLPQSLAACLQRYGLEYLKIKLMGDGPADRERLKAIAELLGPRAATIAFTLDGNEQYRSVDAFRDFWASLTGDRELDAFLSRLLVVEQPMHRDVALADATAEGLRRWRDRPPIIIDESDAELHSLPTALDAGYAGTSHKNCKGVFKGLANACLLAHRRSRDPDRPFVLTGEDLANVGPVALLQDLAVMATLGLEHVERNGHHYFHGLAMLPAPLQQQVLAEHGDLYHADAASTPTLHVAGGRIDLTSVLAAPFGCAVSLDMTMFEPASEWRFASLGV